MNTDEMELAKSALGLLQNTTGHGYEILVRGTAIDNAITLIATMVGVAIVIFTIIYTYRRFKIGEQSDEAFVAWLLSMIVFAFALYVLMDTIKSCIIGISMPEYTAINNIVKAMAVGT